MRATPPSMQDPTIQQGVSSVVIPVKVDVKELFIKGRCFLWPRPSGCPVCGGGLWGHGFVPAYLNCSDVVVFLRRLYCRDCRSVHRLRPDSHWPRFQSSIKTILETIVFRHRHGRWCHGIPRPCQRQWWRRLGRKVKLCLGLSFGGSLPEAFNTLLWAGVIPVSRVMDCSKQPG
jgi:hypothetical protein